MDLMKIWWEDEDCDLTVRYNNFGLWRLFTLIIRVNSLQRPKLLYLTVKSFNQVESERSVSAPCILNYHH